jgi:predicted restriction endonuclease
LIEYNEFDLLPIDCRIGVTEKEIITKVRIQQSKYRNNLLKVLKKCPFTGITDKRLLLASHIKPWSLSTSEEKLDIYNGFILSPLYDKLFDSGLITFTNEKKIIYSSSLSKETMEIIKYKNDYCESLPVEGREEYLYFHNTKIFRK